SATWPSRAATTHDPRGATRSTPRCMLRLPSNRRMPNFDETWSKRRTSMGKRSHGVRAARGLAANEASSTNRAGDMMLAAEPRLRVPSELQRMRWQANNSAAPAFLLGCHAAFMAVLGGYLRL